MNKIELLHRAIESAKCRLYRINVNSMGDISYNHQKKADNQKELMNITVNALEKQIPKKPIPFKRTAHDFQNDICKHSGCYCEHIKTFSHEYEYTDYKCPCCDKRISDGTPNLCVHCGQALDWNESEG